MCNGTDLALLNTVGHEHYCLLAEDTFSSGIRYRLIPLTRQRKLQFPVQARCTSARLLDVTVVITLNLTDRKHSHQPHKQQSPSPASVVNL
jgi:hypothetical protein